MVAAGQSGAGGGSVRRVIAVPSRLAEDLGRVVSKLRTTPSARLSAQLSGPFTSRAEAGRALARTLATAAQGIEDADGPAMPRWRTLPRLADPAVGDQVQVLAYDLLAALPAAPDLVWTPDGRARLTDLMRDVSATLGEVVRFL
jgi:hypothetical protein